MRVMTADLCNAQSPCTDRVHVVVKVSQRWKKTSVEGGGGGREGEGEGIKQI